jgi:hypothetical protein
MGQNNKAEGDISLFRKLFSSMILGLRINKIKKKVCFLYFVNIKIRKLLLL